MKTVHWEAGDVRRQSATFDVRIFGCLPLPGWYQESSVIEVPGENVHGMSIVSTSYPRVR